MTKVSKHVIMILKTVILLFSFSITALTNTPNDDRLINGKVSYYAGRFEGKRTSSGQRYRATNRTAAHRTLPFGTLLEVTNKANGAKTIVKVNDRGPHAKSRVLDLSYSAAKDLSILGKGMAEVSIKVVSLGNGIVETDIEEQLQIEPEITAPQLMPINDDLLTKKRKYIIVVRDAEGNVKLDSTAIRPESITKN